LKKIPKIILGTAQWGSNYGISNRSGKINLKEIEKIVNFCFENDIKLYDTARGYGNAEKIIGKLNKKYAGKTKIISKIKDFRLGNTYSDKKKIRELILTTHKNTFQKNIEGMLIHDDGLLDSKYFPYIWEVLSDLKNEFRIKKIGISTYKYNINIKLLKKYKFDIVQLPFNIYDQTRLNNGFIKKLNDNNIEIHVRSIFLQGILLQDYRRLKGIFYSVRDHQKKTHNYLEQNGMTKIEGCLSAVVQNDIQKIIIGCDSLVQLKEIYKSFVNVTHNSTFKNFKKFSINDMKIINPSLWKINEK
jgi:aryl-alcohol dehydrogenase-like predicted oxidoreductase